MLKKIVNYIQIGFLYLIISLARVEGEILKSVGSSKKGGIITKIMFSHPLLEKFYAGQKDEKYVQQFYEILKKADKFMREASPHKMGASADYFAKTYAKKDKYGRSYEHLGFFDEKHKHHGKTLGEVIDQEMIERRIKDDNYQLIRIVNNQPIDAGLAKLENIFVEKDNKLVSNINDFTKKLEFPIKAVRKKNRENYNNIEQLTEFLHIKQKAFNKRRFEFFIPLKFNTHTFDDKSKIIKDILNVKEIYIRDDYGELTGYRIQKFLKRFQHNKTHEVFRFDGYEMEKL